MSATLGVLLKELNNNLSIDIYERLPLVAEESSDGWNNAGTGHSAFCELNYTPQLDDGSIDIKKALKIAASYEVSKAFWASLVAKGALPDASSFITKVPHISFVWGEHNVAFLQKRHKALTQNPLFEGMQISTDHAVLQQWMPLVMFGREGDETLAATKMDIGTDVNFGVLTEHLINYLRSLDGVNLYTSHEVKGIERNREGGWTITVENMVEKEDVYVHTNFCFIGAGGGSLKLLEKSDIPEGNGYGGFPISGKWLRSINPSINTEHFGKVYGKASVGAPPMSVPHLDTRIISGERQLLFGPYAGFSTKFLKNGSYWDLPLSIEADNIYPMLAAGFKNLPLTKYLVEQVTQSFDEKMQALREYYPTADAADWEEVVAGQRVQIIKKDEKEGGRLEFGTEVISSADGSLAALLGASPGASTSVSIMLELLEKCFPEQMHAKWQQKLRELIPCYKQDLAHSADDCKATRERSAKWLKL